MLLVKREKKMINKIQKICHDFLLRRMSMETATALKILKGTFRDRYLFMNLNERRNLLANVSMEEIDSAFANVSEEERRLLKEFVEFQRKIPDSSGPFPEPFFFCLDLKGGLLEKRLQEKYRVEQRHSRKLGRQYQIAPPFPESLLYHNGLTMVPESVKEYIRNKDFIDAGAYNGDSSIVFLQYFPRKIYAFEPSSVNAEKYRRTMKKNRVPEERFVLIEKGVSDTPEMIRTVDSGGMDFSCLESSSTGEKIELILLDSFCGNLLDVGLIKADLEGMGLKMLRGAVKTIRRCRPLLLLSIYHNPEELFGIYRTLREMDLHYTFQIRSLKVPYGEITLIAYPEELGEMKC